MLHARFSLQLIFNPLSSIRDLESLNCVGQKEITAQVQLVDHGTNRE